MNPQDLLRIVDSLHRDKNIDTEIVFQAIEAAYLSAARKQYGEEADIVVRRWHFTRWDSNEDNQITQDELRRVAERLF